MKSNEIQTTPQHQSEKYADGLLKEEREILDAIAAREADRAARLTKAAETSYTLDPSGNVLLESERAEVTASQHEQH